MANKCVVMRYPVLMEDEGRHEYIRTFESREQAQAWIAKQKNQYFKSEDYYICEEKQGE